MNKKMIIGGTIHTMPEDLGKALASDKAMSRSQKFVLSRRIKNKK